MAHVPSRSRETNLQIAEQFLNLVFEIPSGNGVLPWIGRKTGWRAIVDSSPAREPSLSLEEWMFTT